MSDFESAWRTMQRQVYEIAVEKGWWDEEIKQGKIRNDGEMIALIHSELSEALEALREHNPPSEKALGYSALEEELADAVIRIMDFAEARSCDVAGAVLAKLEFNKTRSVKHGGKRF